MATNGRPGGRSATCLRFAERKRVWAVRRQDPRKALRSLSEGIMSLLLRDRGCRAMAREQGEIVGKRQELLSNALQMGRVERRGVRAPNAAGEQGVADEDTFRRLIAHAAGGVTGRRQKPQAELAEVQAVVYKARSILIKGDTPVFVLKSVQKNRNVPF